MVCREEPPTGRKKPRQDRLYTLGRYRTGLRDSKWQRASPSARTDPGVHYGRSGTWTGVTPTRVLDDDQSVPRVSVFDICDSRGPHLFWTEEQ